MQLKECVHDAKSHDSERKKLIFRQSKLCTCANLANDVVIWQPLWYKMALYFVKVSSSLLS